MADRKKFVATTGSICVGSATVAFQVGPGKFLYDLIIKILSVLGAEAFKNMLEQHPVITVALVAIFALLIIGLRELADHLGFRRLFANALPIVMTILIVGLWLKIGGNRGGSEPTLEPGVTPSPTSDIENPTANATATSSVAEAEDQSDEEGVDEPPVDEGGLDRPYFSYCKDVNNRRPCYAIVREPNPITGREDTLSDLAAYIYGRLLSKDDVEERICRHPYNYPLILAEWSKLSPAEQETYGWEPCNYVRPGMEILMPIIPELE